MKWQVLRIRLQTFANELTFQLVVGCNMGVGAVGACVGVGLWVLFALQFAD